MESLKLRLLNKFGNPDSLETPVEIEVHFPYETSDALVKRMSNGHVKVLSNDRGELSVDLSDFEVQGLKTGPAQSFLIKVFTQGKIKTGTFTRCLNVETAVVEGVERKVLVRK